MITWFWSIKKEESQIFKLFQLTSKVRTRPICDLAMGRDCFELWWDKHSQSCSSHITHLYSSPSSASSFLAHSIHRVTGLDCADAAKVVLWCSGALVTGKLPREAAVAHLFPDNPAWRSEFVFQKAGGAITEFSYNFHNHCCCLVKSKISWTDPEAWWFQEQAVGKRLPYASHFLHHCVTRFWVNPSLFGLCLS